MQPTQEIFISFVSVPVQDGSKTVSAIVGRALETIKLRLEKRRRMQRTKESESKRRNLQWFEEIELISIVILIVR